MNPGPFGMAQTGVPFGDVAMVRDFLGITGPVDSPPREHPKRPIPGFACARSEVSGTRLWGFARDRFGTAERFFERFFVVNYCPLVFMDESGRNLTPDKLPAGRARSALPRCDDALARDRRARSPRARGRHRRASPSSARTRRSEAAIRIGSILHPSPASPAANRGWADAVDARLRALGFDPT